MIVKTKVNHMQMNKAKFELDDTLDKSRLTVPTMHQLQISLLQDYV